MRLGRGEEGEKLGREEEGEIGGQVQLGREEKREEGEEWEWL